MELNGSPAPALGDEERSDEATSAGAGVRPAPPDPEVVAKPKRRRFTAEYRLRIVEEAERCTQPGDVGRLLRREGKGTLRRAAWQKYPISKREKTTKPGSGARFTGVKEVPVDLNRASADSMPCKAIARP